MASLLDSKIRSTVAAAFKGRLLTCVLRRVASSSVDSFGDVVEGAATTWNFDGIVESFRAEFAVAAGIPVTDSRILIIAGSLATTPENDDQVKVRDQWYQLRKLVERDPANATYVFAGFEIEDPT